MASVLLPETILPQVAFWMVGAGDTGSGFIAWSFLGILQGLMEVGLVFVCLLLITVILIQDPKGSGLTSAFGAGPGTDSLLGARAQKDINRFTSYLTGAFLVLVLCLVLLDNFRIPFESPGGKVGSPTTSSTSSEAETSGEGSSLGPGEESPSPGAGGTPKQEE